MGTVNLVGKTIARVEDYGDRLFFTDGTALELERSQSLGYVETQALLHQQQGFREQRRMRMLHDTLHPRDQQYLKLLEDERRGKSRQSMSAFSCALEDIFVESMREQLDASNRLFFGPWKPVKRKRRPPRRIDPAKFHQAGTITIPIKKRKR